MAVPYLQLTIGGLSLTDSTHVNGSLPLGPPSVQWEMVIQALHFLCLPEQLKVSRQVYFTLNIHAGFQIRPRYNWTVQ